MRYFSCVLILLCVAAIRADQPKLSQVEQDVLKARNARTEASNNRDPEAWSRYIADDCIFTTDAGSRLSKAEVSRVAVAKFPHDYDYSVDPRDAVVHVYGDTAVLNLRFTVHEKFTDGEIVSEMRATETDVRRNGSWILVARQWGKIPVNHRKPVSVDVRKYQDYAGQYEWRPLDDVENIMVKDGRLWTQTGKDAPEEMLSMGGDAFFLESELGTNTFVRDRQGRVTGYIYRDADGQEVHVKKIR